ncbi:hypothetical protein [Hymenobacter lapidiphilus]|uniref:Uracil-DNA glycosylase-like domain-containing protein n=1 Tax=Hymenobacter lapidiphilus TaxID=2608003 RepID=A0A7Y7PKZ8_9BACT|nr:hypothetical protein [Hymenobacter lapidiphilus]NVO29672.1 hypothetical protein [Hymenobacter lapidiphilus]
MSAQLEQDDLFSDDSSDQADSNRALALPPLLDEPLAAIWQTPAFAAYCGQDFTLPASGNSGALLFVGLQSPFAGQPHQQRHYDVLSGRQVSATYSMHRLTLQLGVRATYLPVLFHRESPDGYFPIVVSTEAGRHFLRSQLTLFQSTVRALEPSAVVVCSRLASILIRSYCWLHWPLSWDEALGTYRDQAAGTPFFFADDFSGNAHSLDAGSLGRLAWQLRQALGLPAPIPLPWQ